MSNKSYLRVGVPENTTTEEFLPRITREFSTADGKKPAVLIGASTDVYVSSEQSAVCLRIKGKPNTQQRQILGLKQV